MSLQKGKAVNAASGR